MIISWNVALPRTRSLWDTVVLAYEKEKNRKAVASSIDLTQKQLDKMISGTEGRQLSVRRFEEYLDSLAPEGLGMILDYLDWKYRVPKEQKRESINGEMKDLMEEVHRLLDLHQGTQR